MANLHDALIRVTRDFDPSLDVHDTLQAIVHGAHGAFPEFDHVGITVAEKDGTLETLAATDEVVKKLDTLQYELGEGPCLHALDQEANEPVVILQYADQEQQWPRFAAAAVAGFNLKSQMGLRFFTEAQSTGGLNMYSVSSQTISEETISLAQLFGSYAAIALGKAQREEQLSSAIATRQLVGQATGIVMERFGLTESRAFEYLLRVSSTSNVKLRDVARQVVDTPQGPDARSEQSAPQGGRRDS